LCLESVNFFIFCIEFSTDSTHPTHPDEPTKPNPIKPKAPNERKWM
jgi:hypothetical protein